MGQQEAAAGRELVDAFMNYDGFSEFLRKFVIPTVQNPVDPTASILVLQALYNIEERVHSQQFQMSGDLRVKLKEILRRWRCQSQPNIEYNQRVALLLSSLNIFKEFGVPLFTDNFGKKQRLSDYEDTEVINSIDENTNIVHVTHKEEAEKISIDRKFKPSANKNIIPGCWFGLPADDSHYGTYSFRTTLSALGIKGLHQGEIVSYKREVNVILYADDEEVGFNSLEKPTLEAVKNKHGRHAYVHESIFVPERFLQVEDFPQVVEKDRIERHTMCIRQLRTGYTCNELSYWRLGKQRNYIINL